MKKTKKAGTITRNFTISKKGGSHSKQVQLFQFIGWPHHENPKNCEDFLEFTQFVKKSHQNMSLDGPIVVHDR